MESIEPFTVIGARLSGRPVRGKSLDAPFFGVRSAHFDDVDDEKWWQRRRREVFHSARAFDVRMPHAQVFSHTTAALLIGMRVPNWVGARPLHVGAIDPNRAPRLGGIHGHSLMSSTPRSVVEQLHVTSPVETWCSLGETLALDDLIIMGDGLVCRQHPLASMNDLVRAVRGSAGRPGVRKLREALEWIRPGTDSARETLLRLLIVRAGFREPEVNGVILDARGKFVAFADLLYREERVAVEYDGGHHREDESQFHRDVDRLDNIMELEYRVIRVNKSLMARPPILFGKLRTALTRHSTVQDD